MSKSNANHKEKSSFWKKFGLGKSKSSVTSFKSEIQKQQQDDAVSFKSKRSSGLYLYQSPPQQRPPSPPPPIPSVSITPKPCKSSPVTPKPSASSPIVFQDNKVDDKETRLSQRAKKMPVPSTKPTSNNEQDMITSPTKTTTIEAEDPNVTLSTGTKSSDNKLDPATGTTNNKEQDSQDELLATINDLKAELEKEKAIVNVLQKQKQAVAKDLDYFELTVDELFTEKTDLLQQLEDEKIKSQHHLDDLNLLLDKMKSTADNARDQSFAVDQSKLEFETYQQQVEEEKSILRAEIAVKDKTIRELKAKLNKSKEQNTILKSTMDQLIKTHTEELVRATQKAQSDKENSNNQSNSWPLHTPNGSPRIQPEIKHDKSEYIPVPSANQPYDNQNVYGTPQSMLKMDSSSDHHCRTPKNSTEYIDDLDDQLMKLTKEKEKLQSYYSKIPLSGGGPQARKRKEELEAMLDQVDSQLSKVKQKIRKS